MPKSHYPPTYALPFLRPTWAEIDLGAFRHNFREIKRKFRKGVSSLPVVKADGYGHGMEEIARASLSCGAKLLGVANIEEGIFLRKRGITAPILILGSVYPLSNFSYILRYNLSPTICSLEASEELSKIAKRRRRKVRVHIKVDTGMGRIGISAQNAVSLVKRVVQLPGVLVEGIFTHLAAADSDYEFTMEQIRKFQSVTDGLKRDNISIKYIHAANSTAILAYPDAHFNLVRPGISLYGLVPFEGAEREIDLKPVMQLKTRIVFIKRVKKGTSISYGRTWKAKRESIIGTLPIGYADGYSRLLSNRGEVLICGSRVPIVGRVCMDMCMVDVTPPPDVKVGEEVVLIGSQGKERITADEIAKLTGTITYEVVCGISKRVPRIYLRREE
ncbi:MAG: alanine racemase [bacterium]